MRKLTAGYNRPLAEQFFRRSVQDILKGSDEFDFISSGEVDYLAPEFPLFVTPKIIGAPQLNIGAYEMLLLFQSTRQQPLLARIESAANQLLFFEGLTKGVVMVSHDAKTAKLIAKLYATAAVDRKVLEQISLHTLAWIILLGRIGNNDLLEDLGQAVSPLLIS